MIQKPPIGIKPEFICIRDRINDIQMAMDRYLDAGMTIPYSWTEEYIRLLTEKEKAEKRFEENFGRVPDMITKEQAAEWFEKMHPPGPAAREMYRMAAEALRAQSVVERSLSPRESFPSDDEYIAYLIGVIRNLETVRRNLRAIIEELEDIHGE